MARRGWFVPGFTHDEDNKLVGDLRKIGKAYRRQFQAALRAPSGEIVDPKGDFLYVYLDEENYKKCREKNVLVPNAGDGVLATALEPHSESYTYRQVREQLQAFCGDGVINYAANGMRRLRPIDFPVAKVGSSAWRWSYEHVGESRTSSL
ncbi:RolB family protein [Agrobacterium vitis]|uniref:RolB family protein n=1 Tax=Agrobacterium vitis TaxID=373 RepID=UPI0012E89DDA|nr:RolB family protein [Agrobacterium vitis]MUZ66052.1 hypothetical protein [Agrobacterium vitis]